MMERLHYRDWDVIMVFQSRHGPLPYMKVCLVISPNKGTASSVCVVFCHSYWDITLVNSPPKKYSLVLKIDVELRFDGPSDVAPLVPPTTSSMTTSSQSLSFVTIYTD